MWTLEQLRERDIPQACINDKWVSARPLNYTREYMSFLLRLQDAWKVFVCRAEAFTWPEGQ